MWGTFDMNVQIGGSAPGAGNLVCGNGGSGISIDNSYMVACENVIIQGNRIGVDAAGNALGTATASTSRATCGLPGSAERPGEGNVISGTGRHPRVGVSATAFPTGP